MFLFLLFISYLCRQKLTNYDEVVSQDEEEIRAPHIAFRFLVCGQSAQQIATPHSQRENRPLCAHNPLEFEGFRNQAGLNAFTLSATQWIEKTNAIGLISKAGRYGGTQPDCHSANAGAGRE